MTIKQEVNVESLPPDIFCREKAVYSMCQWIVELPAEDYSPFVLDGKWGAGKTVHALRMKRCFETCYAEKVKCIYWNASNYDYSECPLLMFVAVLYQSIAEEKLRNSDNNILSLWNRLIQGTLGGTASIGIQILEKYIGVNLAEVIRDAKDSSKECDSGSSKEKLFEKLLNNVADEKFRVDGARELVQLVQEEGKELVIIIDELDRCRPNFALKTLELIKHLFSVSNCKFLLVMNKESIVDSVKHLYGFDAVSAIRYLDKYLKFEFFISGRCLNYSYSDGAPQQYFWDLLKINKLKIADRRISDFLNVVFNKNRIELRDVEKYVNNIKFMMSVSNRSMDKINVIICFVAYLFTFERELLNDMYHRSADVDLIMNKIGGENEHLIDSNGRSRVPSYVNVIQSILHAHMMTFEQRQHNRDTYDSHIWCLLEELEEWISRCVYVRG